MFYHVSCVGFFFFKQKTAYEMRISDWSSDVCSSDLAGLAGFRCEFVAIHSHVGKGPERRCQNRLDHQDEPADRSRQEPEERIQRQNDRQDDAEDEQRPDETAEKAEDRKSTRLNSSH